MTDEQNPTARAYDQYYRNPNHFGYRSWLYRPYISALIKRAQLPLGSRILDVGCGQGFFSHLFAQASMSVHGIDLSAEGIAGARALHKSPLLTFEACDVFRYSPTAPFDAVFVRSCSLYNSPAFSADPSFSKHLMSFLKPNGVLLFDYHTKLNSWRGTTNWRHHSLHEAKLHFAALPGSRLFFSTRLPILLFGTFAISPLFTGIDYCISKLTGLGGEIIAIVPKSPR
jgi:SAM-dependent methyltransferase